MYYPYDVLMYSIMYILGTVHEPGIILKLCTIKKEQDSRVSWETCEDNNVNRVTS